LNPPIYNGKGNGILSGHTGSRGSAGYFSNIGSTINTDPVLYSISVTEGEAFEANNYGTGKAANFWITNSNSSSNALMVGSNGKASTINVGTTGTSFAGVFSNMNSNSSIPAVGINTYGSSYSLSVSGSSADSKGIFSSAPNLAIDAISDGSGNTLESVATGSGWAGAFFSTGTGHGVYISAPYGKTGLNVGGGTKNAIVPTSQGARKLYTEESSEVWFTDYGFATLTNGSAIIEIDRLFAETVSFNEPYHVFVQPYDDASLYVSERTSSGFTVRSRDNSQDVEFSYRIVAKRKGYELARLEHEPMGDDDPNLYPEKQGAMKINTGRFLNSSDEQRRILDEQQRQLMKASNGSDGSM